MSLHFSLQEFAARQARCREELVARDLDGLLVFKQESMYYLTGYDTMGFLWFMQTLLVNADGSLSLLTRAGDLTAAQQTSTITDIRIWVDRAGANPADDIREMLASRELAGKRIGIEYHGFAFTARRGKMLDAALDGFCTCIDASDLVDGLRHIKSSEELACVRKSAALTEAVFDAANRLTVPGASLAHIRAGMLSVAVEGGGDPPGVRWPLSSGKHALNIRYHTGTENERVGANDQVTHEFGVSYRHYYTVLMHVIVTGDLHPRHREMFAACRDALDACEESLRAGKTLGDVFAAHTDVFTRAGYAGKFLNTCGYPLGATYPPTWVEEPLIYRGNPLELRPGMVIFLYMYLRDAERGLTMSLGETSLVTNGSCERLTHAPRELIVR